MFQYTHRMKLNFHPTVFIKVIKYEVKKVEK